MSDALAAPMGKGDGLTVAPIPAELRSWICTSLRLGADDSFTTRFERAETTDWIEVTVVPLGAPGRVFQELPHCAVRYRGSLAAADAERRAEVLALVSSVAASIEARLAAAPGATIPEVLGRRRESGRVVFGRDMLRQLLAPTIVEGVAVIDGWTLADVYPSSYAREEVGQNLELVLDFRRAADLRRALVVVSRRLGDKPCFAETANFALTYLSLGNKTRDGAESLRAFVAFTLQLRDYEGLEVVFPDVAADVAPALLMPAKPEEKQGPKADWLNLAISSECSQSCNFCSIKEMAPASDGGDALFARLSADLVSSRQRGVEGIRVNGYDPLSYSKILDVLEYAKDLGYARAHVFSPCTLLADRAFCAEIVAALPAERRFFVPMYAASAEAHDKVVGREGAHALVMKAIDNLIELAGRDAIAILSVVTKENLAEMVELARFAEGKRLSFSAHMPYPSAESRADRYFESAPKQTSVAEAFVPAYKDGWYTRYFPVNGVAPCVAFRAMTARGVKAKRWLDAPEKRPLLPGSEYKDPSFTHGAGRRESAAFVSTAIECPHAKDCALAPACPGELLRSYVELYGIDEVKAVTLRELLEAY